MPAFSIIVGFRDRETVRVKRFLESLENQTYSDFECLFVDYGSSREVADEIRELCSGFEFCRYIYNHVEGWFWNRSHALNTGIRQAAGTYLICTDIDMIFTESVMKTMAETAHPNAQYFSRVYKLPQSFTDYSSLQNKPTAFELSGVNGMGGFHCAHRDIFESVSGFDEFFCIWGKEDEDCATRISATGIDTNWLDPGAEPIYHQWHPSENPKKKQFPQQWWDQIYLRFALNKHQLSDLSADWGSLVTESDRTVSVQNAQTKIDVRAQLNPFERGKLLTQIIDHLIDQAGSTIQVQVAKPDSDIKLVDRTVHRINNIIGSMGGKFRLNRTTHSTSTIAMHSVSSMLLQLIHFSPLDFDYFISDDQGSLNFYLHASGNGGAGQHEKL